MATEREIALEQALVMVIGVAKLQGVDDKALIDKAKHLLTDHHSLRYLELVPAQAAILEISNAHATALASLD